MAGEPDELEAIGPYLWSDLPSQPTVFGSAKSDGPQHDPARRLTSLGLAQSVRMSTCGHCGARPWSYDPIVVAFAGGKDCTAALLHLLERGADPRRIELAHHDIDAGGPTLMDWPTFGTAPGPTRAAHFTVAKARKVKAREGVRRA